MEIDEFRNRVYSLVSFIGFEFRGLPCGIDPININHFEMWCGENFAVAKSIDEVMNIKLFEGNSILEIYSEIRNIDY